LGIIALAWPLVLVGCGAQSPAEKLRVELQNVKSNAATAHMVGDAWAHGDVPAAYAKNSLQMARGELKSAVEALAELPEAQKPAEDGTTLQEHLQRIEKSVDEMSEAAEKGDRAAVAGQVEQLSSEEEALDKIARRLGAGE
jgi:nucleoid-associated protein YgaU